MSHLLLLHTDNNSYLSYLLGRNDMGASIPQQVVDAVRSTVVRHFRCGELRLPHISFYCFVSTPGTQILAGVRTATVDVQDVSPHQDCSQLEVTVVSPFFEGKPKFKRRDMVNSSLDGLRKDPNFYSDIVTLTMLSPSESASTEAS